MKKKVLVLGTGLAGAFAANACSKDSNIDLTVMGVKPYGAPVPGAMWFHWVPFSAKRIKIANVGYGTADYYLRKQWGMHFDTTGVSSSFPSSPIRYEIGYSIEETLPRLWNRIAVKLVGPLIQQDLDDLGKEFHLVIQTFLSGDRLTRARPNLVNIPISTLEGLGNMEMDSVKYTRKLDPDTDLVCIYDGTPNFPWVRSTMDTHAISKEYPHTMPIPSHFAGSSLFRFVQDIMPRSAPLSNRQGNVLYVGRLATMNRRYLSHHAYADTRKALKEL